jgi:hypothetical protein
MWWWVWAVLGPCRPCAGLSGPLTVGLPWPVRASRDWPYREHGVSSDREHGACSPPQEGRCAASGLPQAHLPCMLDEFLPEFRGRRVLACQFVADLLRQLLKAPSVQIHEPKLGSGAVSHAAS